MRRSFAFMAVALSLLSAPAFAHAQSDRGLAKLALGGRTISIDYGRPSLRGRDMLGQAQIGQVWRMGADAATTLTSEADLAFGLVTVPKGSYQLRAKKAAEDKWILLVEPEGKAALEVPLTSSTLATSVEMFTLELRGERNAGEFEMRWGTTALKASFTVK